MSAAVIAGLVREECAGESVVPPPVRIPRLHVARASALAGLDVERYLGYSVVPSKVDVRPIRRQGEVV